MDKDITLAAAVPASWLGGLLAMVLYTIISPILFVYALLRPEGLGDLPGLFGELLGGESQGDG